jgi:hypothetical protein
MTDYSLDSSQSLRNTLQFKFFKNQEIPEFHYDMDSDKYFDRAHPDAVKEDYVDLNFSIIDNGDEKLVL